MESTIALTREELPISSFSLLLYSTTQHIYVEVE